MIVRYVETKNLNYNVYGKTSYRREKIVKL